MSDKIIEHFKKDMIYPNSWINDKEGAMRKKEQQRGKGDEEEGAGSNEGGAKRRKEQ